MPGSREKARGRVVGLPAFAVAFAVAFAGATLATALLMFFSAPALGSTVAASFEGEAMNLPSGAGVVSSDGAASGGRTLVVWSNATASKRASTPRADRLLVRAKADQCQGSPQMTVEVDGRRVMRRWVWQTGYANHGVGLDLARGTHRIEITMGHDYRASSSCDRNLRVDKVSFVSSTGPSTDPSPPGPGPTTGSDVFEGAKLYVDPYSNAKRQAEEWRASRPADAARMDEIAAQPDADWFGGWSGQGDALRAAVNDRVRTITDAGALPVLVAYNIPNRDCGGHSGGGAASPEAYKAWIRSFADGIGGRKAAVILEPDAVALTGCLSEADEQTRLALIKDAVNVLKLRSGGNTAVYVDAGHSGWVGAQEMAARLEAAGIAGADGFSLNVSNFGTTAQSTGYGKDLSSRLAGRGHPGKRFVIDTSRNGLGPSPDEQWCNPLGRALGERPTSETADPLVDAYLWIKAPGESDGTCNGGPPAGAWWPEYALGLAQRS